MGACLTKDGKKKRQGKGDASGSSGPNRSTGINPSSQGRDSPRPTNHSTEVVPHPLSTQRPARPPASLTNSQHSAGTIDQQHIGILLLHPPSWLQSLPSDRGVSSCRPTSSSRPDRELPVTANASYPQSRRDPENLPSTKPTPRGQKGVHSPAVQQMAGTSMDDADSNEKAGRRDLDAVNVAFAPVNCVESTSAARRNSPASTLDQDTLTTSRRQDDPQRFSASQQAPLEAGRRSGSGSDSARNGPATRAAYNRPNLLQGPKPKRLNIKQVGKYLFGDDPPQQDAIADAVRYAEQLEKHTAAWIVRRSNRSDRLYSNDMWEISRPSTRAGLSFKHLPRGPVDPIGVKVLSSEQKTLDGNSWLVSCRGFPDTWAVFPTGDESIACNSPIDSGSQVSGHQQRLRANRHSDVPNSPVLAPQARRR